MKILVMMSFPDSTKGLIKQTDCAGPASGSGQASAGPAPAPGIVFDVWPKRAAGEDKRGGDGRARGAAGQRRRRGGSDDEE